MPNQRLEKEKVAVATARQGRLTRKESLEEGVKVPIWLPTYLYTFGAHLVSFAARLCGVMGRIYAQQFSEDRWLVSRPPHQFGVRSLAVPEMQYPLHARYSKGGVWLHGPCAETKAPPHFGVLAIDWAVYCTPCVIQPNNPAYTMGLAYRTP